MLRQRDSLSATVGAMSIIPRHLRRKGESEILLHRSWGGTANADPGARHKVHLGYWCLPRLRSRKPPSVKHLVFMQKNQNTPKIEEALQHFEGAHYALHDLVAFLLARAPHSEVQTVFKTLGDQVSAHAEKIGEIRLAGYVEELESVQAEVAHSRNASPKLLARLGVVNRRQD